MMKRLSAFLTTSLALLTLASFSATAHAQGCSRVVTADEAGVITKPSVIEKAAISLLDQGADVHVLTIKRMADYGHNLAAAEAAYESKCPDWKAPGGVARKPNLLVFVVAPEDHKKDVFFGTRYAAAFERPDVVNLLYSKAANPSFRNGDFAGGLAAALTEFGDKVRTHREDPTGSHAIIKWIIALFLLLFLIWLIYYLMRTAKQAREKIARARAKAMSAKNEATRSFRSLAASSPYYESFAQRFSDLSNSITYDPASEGRSLAEYEAMERAWVGFVSEFTTSQYGSRVAPSFAQQTANASRTVAPASNNWQQQQQAPPRSYNSNWQQAPAPAPQNITIINEERSDSGLMDFAAGMMIADALENRQEERRYEEAPRYYEPQREPERSFYEPESSQSNDRDNDDNDTDFGSGSDSSSDADFSSGDDSSF